jgi:hypothetical protein
MQATSIPFDAGWTKDANRSLMRPMLWIAAVSFTAGFGGYLALALPAMTAG